MYGKTTISKDGKYIYDKVSINIPEVAVAVAGIAVFGTSIVSFLPYVLPCLVPSG